MMSGVPPGRRPNLCEVLDSSDLTIDQVVDRIVSMAGDDMPEADAEPAFVPGDTFWRLVRPWAGPWGRLA